MFYGSVIVIAIRIIAPGNRTRGGLLHLRGVVSGAVHFVDAAGGYSDVATCCAVGFVAGTCALRFVTSSTKRSRGITPLVLAGRRTSAIERQDAF